MMLKFNFVTETIRTMCLMKKLFYILIATASIALYACENDEPTTPNDQQPPVEEQPNPDEGEDDGKDDGENGDESEATLFSINIDAEMLSAYSVSFDILPADKEALYYFDIISKARVATLDVATIKAEIEEGARGMAQMTGTPYEEVLASMLTAGDKLDEYSYAGYRPETEYCVYAFYWDAESCDDIVTKEFKTLAVVESTESVDVTFSDVSSYAMTVSVAPTDGVTDYWYYFAEKSKAEAMLAELEDENAFLSYHAMNVGTRNSGDMSFEQKGLKPATEYTVLVMAIDEALCRLLVEERQLTLEDEVVERVESELFTALLGEWSGTQTITDLYIEPEVSQFTVNFVETVEGATVDYRAKNQLVAEVDGWCKIPYYDINGLIADGIEEPEDKFGPKWLFNIAEGDVVTLDGKAKDSVIGWLFFGDCYMFNMNPETQTIDTDTDVEVVVSEDCNTITIKSPDTMEGYYPGVAYFFQGYGWMAYYYGTTDIVLTR